MLEPTIRTKYGLIKSYANMLYINNYPVLSELVVTLPSMTGVFDRSLVCPGGQSIVDLREYVGALMKAPLPDGFDQSTECAVLLRMCQGKELSDKITNDTYISDLLLVDGCVKILDTGVSLDFLIRTVKWTDLLLDVGVFNKDDKLIGLSLSVINSLKYIANGGDIAIRPEYPDPINCFSKRLSAMHNLPVLCPNGPKCYSHFHVSNVEASKHDEVVCAGSISLPFPANGADIGLLEKCLTAALYL